jgi:hypothetical protein
MTEMTAASAGATPTKGWKKGLPQADLKDAEEWAGKLWGCARLSSASAEVFAKELGLKSASGGRWDVKLALLRNYKLIKVDGDQISLTPLGQRLINGSDREQQAAARREAMQTLKAYKDLLDTYAGTPLPEKSSLAGKLEFEYGKTTANAEAAAQAFLDSLAHAQMVTADGMVSLTGEAPGPTPNSEPVVEDEDEQAAEALDAAEEELEAEESAAVTADPDEEKNDEQLTVRRAAGPVSLAVTLDLSQFRADEVVQILRELGLAMRR